MSLRSAGEAASNISAQDRSCWCCFFSISMSLHFVHNVLPPTTRMRTDRWQIRAEIGSRQSFDKLQKAAKSFDFTAFCGGPEGIRTHDLTDANRTLSQTVHLYAPQTTRKSTLIHRILSQKIRKCIWPRFILRLKMSTNRSKKLSCIITRILLGCQHNGNNTVRIPLGEC